MLKIKCFLLVAVLMLSLCGCANPEKGGQITVDGQYFSIEEINEGIKNTLNNHYYYQSDDPESKDIWQNKNLILGKEIEYDIYFKPNSNEGEKAFILPPTIYVVITNLEHPSSTEEIAVRYLFGIDVTKFGLRSYFNMRIWIEESEVSTFFSNGYSGSGSEYIGKFTMRIDEIKKPSHQKMDDDWKRKAETAIKLYMDGNGTPGSKEDNLLPGKYKVYVQGFSRSDENTYILFENEKGEFYLGQYYFVNTINETAPANLNHVELVEEPNAEPMKSYIDKVILDPAIMVEYSVE